MNKIIKQYINILDEYFKDPYILKQLNENRIRDRINKYYNKILKSLKEL